MAYLMTTRMLAQNEFLEFLPLLIFLGLGLIGWIASKKQQRRVEEQRRQQQERLAQQRPTPEQQQQQQRSGHASPPPPLARNQRAEAMDRIEEIRRRAQLQRERNQQPQLSMPAPARAAQRPVQAPRSGQVQKTVAKSFTQLSERTEVAAAWTPVIDASGLTIDLASTNVAQAAFVYHEIFAPPKAIRQNAEIWDR